MFLVVVTPATLGFFLGILKLNFFSFISLTTTFFSTFFNFVGFLRGVIIFFDIFLIISSDDKVGF